MAIQTSVPAATRRPGTFFEFNIANAARGLVALTQRIALVGAFDSSGTATALTLYEVFSEQEADDLFGQGSELALMCKYAFRGQRDIGVPVQVWAVPIADPAGTAQAQTFTVTGTATESGEVVIEIAGRTVRAPVTNGDVQNTIASALKDRIDEQLPELPITAGVAINVVTCTHVNTGVNGNSTQYKVVSTPSGVTVVDANSASGAGTIDITLALDELADKDYDLVACSNHTSTDVTDYAAHLSSMFNPGTKRWRSTVMAETGSLATGQALATAADDFKQMVISAEGFKNTPGEVAAYVCGILGGAADPALPWNNVALPSLFLPETADIPTNTEIESGIGGGLFMLSVNEQQTEAKIVRAVTTQTTLNSAPFFALLDYTISRTMFFAARQVDAQLLIQFQRAKKNARTIRRVRSVVLSTLVLLEGLELLQNVEARAGELQVETDATNPDRLNVAIPTSVVPPLNQIVNVMNLIVE